MLGIAFLLFIVAFCGASADEGLIGEPGGVLGWLYDLWSLVAPGGKLHPSGFLENRGHLVVECILVAVIVYLLRLPRSKPSNADKPLTEKEIDELCQEWKPEPLVPRSTPSKQKQIVISSATGPHLTVDGSDLLNMVSMDFLGLSMKDDIREICRSTIEKYGVGSCGPRGFYGTVDVHITLENELARFMQTEEAIIYSFDMASAASVLPAFANRRDLIVCDEAVHYPIQNGCNLSRARVLMFKHNDMDDLKRVLEMVDAEDKVQKKPLNRRFIVVEGIYHYLGDLAPLDKIYELKEKYKYRLMVDESLAFGVLGENGRGASEHFGLPPGAVEIITASMSTALASVGGFCVGDREIIDHQRLSGLGYCYSASLPPYLASAASGALAEISSEDASRKKCRRNAELMRQQLADIKGLQLLGSEPDLISPVMHLDLKDPSSKYTADEKVDVMTNIIDGLREHSILATLTECTPLDWKKRGPLIRVVVTAAHKQSEIQQVASAFKKTVEKIL
ncbi:hypothetical protein BSKO_03201 [Bryopsis sp. KO-2023]|nr:hypothetical protein BSKO_03201 [Bryopsis sp. KO-2023]